MVYFNYIASIMAVKDQGGIAGNIGIALSTLSIVICLLVIVLSFRKNGRHVLKWKIVQRFIVLGSLCDLMFYASQMVFGVHISITKEVPDPIVCSIYAFLILYFAMAQCRLTLITAVVAYVLIKKKKQINFGKYDWKVLLLMFTDPLILLSIVAAMKGMEFNGIYCGLKEGKGVLWNFLLIFLQLAVILVFIVVMYFLIWFQIYKEGRRIAETIGEQSVTAKALVKVTQNLSFFIIVFVLRFSFPAVHGIWVYTTYPPLILYKILSFATCAGGIFNGIIYLTVRRNHL